MAGHGIFIGWGEIFPGRERQSRKVFGEALTFMAEQEQAGNIESNEVVVLSAHGGGLQGFMLMRGDRDKLYSVISSPERQRIATRAGLHRAGLRRRAGLEVGQAGATPLVKTTSQARDYS